MDAAIRKEIDATLDEFEKNVRANPKMLNAQKDYIVKGIRNAVLTLIDFCKLIREGEPYGYSLKLPVTTEMGEGVTHGSRGNVNSIQEAYVAAGQSFTSLLFGWNLRDKITDKIEYAYGISFSGLRIHKAVTHKETGEVAYVLFDCRQRHGGDKMSLAIKGKWASMPLEEFTKTYNE